MIVLSSFDCKTEEHVQVTLVILIDYEDTQEVKRRGVSHTEWDAVQDKGTCLMTDGRRPLFFTHVLHHEDG